MDVSVLHIRGKNVVKPLGAVDSKTATALQEPLMQAIATSNNAVEVDCSAVPYISSAGLRVLVLAAKALHTRQARLKLVNVATPVFAVLSLANFTTFIDVEGGSSP
jgi:anti-anti-sigma factor